MQAGTVSTEAPRPMPYGASAGQAVLLCRNWMVYLGATDAVEAVGPVRVVCDLYSRRFIAWVDNGRGNLGQDLVRRAASVASEDGRRPLVFVRGGVPSEARQQADALGVALFWYASIDGRLEGVSALGSQFRASGLNG